MKNYTLLKNYILRLLNCFSDYHLYNILDGHSIYSRQISAASIASEAANAASNISIYARQQHQVSLSLMSCQEKNNFILNIALFSMDMKEF